MDLFDDIEFEKERQRLLKTYNCKNLKEVIAFLENKIKLQKERNFEENDNT